MTKENIQYAGFWPRLLAICVDNLIALFVLSVFYYTLPLNRISATFYALLDVSLYLFYCVLMLGFFGQTVGMMVSKIKVKKLNLKEIYCREACLRYVVNFVQALIFITVEFYYIKDANESLFVAKDYGHFIVGLEQTNPPLHLMVIFNVYFSWIWTFSEVVVLLMNEKKRAIHDYIAGTVVVNSSKK